MADELPARSNDTPEEDAVATLGELSQDARKNVQRRISEGSAADSLGDPIEEWGNRAKGNPKQSLKVAKVGYPDGLPNPRQGRNQSGRVSSEGATDTKLRLGQLSKRKMPRSTLPSEKPRPKMRAKFEEPTEEESRPDTLKPKPKRKKKVKKEAAIKDQMKNLENKTASDGKLCVLGDDNPVGIVFQISEFRFQRTQLVSGLGFARLPEATH